MGISGLKSVGRPFVWWGCRVSHFSGILALTTSCADYKRQDNRAAALQELKTKLEEQFNDSLTGDLQFLLLLPSELHYLYSNGSILTILNANY